MEYGESHRPTQDIVPIVPVRFSDGEVTFLMPVSDGSEMQSLWEMLGSHGQSREEWMGTAI